MILRDLARRDSLVTNTNAKLIIIVAVVAGATVVLSVTGFGLRVLHRRRRINKRFRDACSREPQLTWDEYERRGRLTRSRLLLEEELQRNNMIRKSQQSRASDCNDAAPAGHPRPRRSPSARTNGGGSGRGGGVVDAEARGGNPPREVRTDWVSAEATVERSWRLLHGERSPSAGGRAGGPLWNEDDEDAPRRPPTVRLKTPPLLSHPIFRDGGEASQPEHLSLPSELTCARPDSGNAASVLA